MLLPILRRLQAPFRRARVASPDALGDCLSDFYLAWDLAAITPKLRERHLPPMITALMFDDEHLTDPLLNRILNGLYLPESVRNFPPWLKAATRAIWMRKCLDFAISRNFKRRALQ